MEPFAVPVIAGVIVGMLNKYVLDFRWCTALQTWYDGDDDNEWYDDDDDDEDESDMTPASSTAISTDTTMTHHVLTHVY